MKIAIKIYEINSNLAPWNIIFEINVKLELKITFFANKKKSHRYFLRFSLVYMPNISIAVEIKISKLTALNAFAIQIEILINFVWSYFFLVTNCNLTSFFYLSYNLFIQHNCYSNLLQFIWYNLFFHQYQSELKFNQFLSL